MKCLTEPVCAVAGAGHKLQRWLAEKVEIWSQHEADGALKSALDCYGMQGDKATVLSRMAEQESEVLILHEIGEAMAEPMLGPVWREMLMSFSSRRAIFMARSVRDNLADCLYTLPELVKRKQTCSIHFYFSNLEGLRRSLFPQLVSGYERWRDRGNASLLLAAAKAGRTHSLAGGGKTVAGHLAKRSARRSGGHRQLGRPAWATCALSRL